MKTGRIISLTVLINFVLIATFIFYSIHMYSSAIKDIKIEASGEIPKYGDISVENGGSKIIEEMVIKFLDKKYVVMGLPGDGSEYKQHIDSHMEGKFSVNVKIKHKKDNTKVEKDLTVCIPSSYPHLTLYVTDDDVKVSEQIRASERIRALGEFEREPNIYGYGKNAVVFHGQDDYKERRLAEVGAVDGHAYLFYDRVPKEEPEEDEPDGLDLCKRKVEAEMQEESCPKKVA